MIPKGPRTPKNPSRAPDAKPLHCCGLASTSSTERFWSSAACRAARSERPGTTASERSTCCRNSALAFQTARRQSLKARWGERPEFVFIKRARNPLDNHGCVGTSCGRCGRRAWRASSLRPTPHVLDGPARERDRSFSSTPREAHHNFTAPRFARGRKPRSNSSTGSMPPAGSFWHQVGANPSPSAERPSGSENIGARSPPR